VDGDRAVWIHDGRRNRWWPAIRLHRAGRRWTPHVYPCERVVARCALALTRFIWPVPISFNQAIPIAVLGLAVNIASVLLLSGGGHDHGHSHGHSHATPNHDHDQAHEFQTSVGPATLEIFEVGVPPRFRLSFAGTSHFDADDVSIETIRPDGTREMFAMSVRAGYLESIGEIPEPHAFTARVSLKRSGEVHAAEFVEHEHAHSRADRDNNMRAAIVHVLGDTAVSVLVIVGLLFGRLLGWTWMDPVVGLVGALVIALWAYSLVRDTGAVLLDMNPDQRMAERMRATIETGGDRITDLHLWRLGPGHLGAILSVATQQQRGPEYYESLLSRFRALSHVTVQVKHVSN
jgi:cation diffusion facilitator family transporter